MIDLNCPFFSIIMPVYNAEKYLEQALDSILTQSFQDFELIAVDDCSSDGSLSILKQFAEKDSRIHVIANDVNLGAAASRNKGLEVFSGIYLGFADADDALENNFYETVYYSLVAEEVDCLKVGVYEDYYDCYGILVQSTNVFSENELITDEAIIKRRIVDLELKPLFGYLWNSFYKGKIIRDYNIRFNTKYKINEDFDFNILFFEYVKFFQILNYCGYHYAKRVDNSLSTRRQDKYYENHMMKINGLLTLYPSIKAIPNDVREKIFWLYTRFAFSSMERNYRDGMAISDAFSKVRSDFLYSLFCSTEFVNISLKQKILIKTLMSGNIAFVYVLVGIITFIKSYMPYIFANIKR